MLFRTHVGYQVKWYSAMLATHASFLLGVDDDGFINLSILRRLKDKSAPIIWSQGLQYTNFAAALMIGPGNALVYLLRSSSPELTCRLFDVTVEALPELPRICHRPLSFKVSHDAIGYADTAVRAIDLRESVPISGCVDHCRSDQWPLQASFFHTKSWNTK